MFLLQASMAAGSVVLILYGIIIVVGTILLTHVFMKIYWRNVGKKNNIIESKPYYKDPVPFFTSIIISIALITVLFYILTLIADKVFPVYFD